MRKARAEAEFRARLAELGVTLLEPEYLGAATPHRAVCPVGHECWPHLGNLKRGRAACRTCTGRDPKAAESAFRQRVAELGGDVLESEWLGNHARHQVRCAAGHMAEVRPNSVQQGGGICAICAGRSGEGAEAEFKTRLAKMGAVLLEAEWLGVMEPHRIRCAEGHEVTIRPHHVRGRNGRCRICSRRDSAAAARAFGERLTELGAVLLEPEWLGSGRPHRVRCAAGHECSPRPDAVQRGQGVCRRCSGKTWDVFYVVANDDAGLLKFGITTGTGLRRLRHHRRDGFDTVYRLLSGLPGDTAPSLERDVLAALRRAGEVAVRGREYYPDRVAALVLDIVDHYPGIPRPR